jgi:hypothetical protein
MIPSLKNPELKVERAKEHLDVLNVKLREFTETEPFSITTEENLQKSLYIMRLHIPTIDPKLAILAADAVYNLRSALDHIAWQLALTIKTRPYVHTAFPIIDVNKPEKMRKFDMITKDIPSIAIDEIKTFQPYLRGTDYKGDLLWKLDKLCNIDKHRIIPAQGTALNFKIPEGIKPRIGTMNDDYIVAMPIAVKAQMQFAPPFTTDILFGSEVDGLVISVGELSKIYDYVRDDVIPRFLRFFTE